MVKRLTAALILVLAFSAEAQGQFVTSGNESPRVKWNCFTTDNYKFIYPREYDYLAMEYAREWEIAAACLGHSIGYGPNTMYSKPLPVILHPYSALSNASVIWAPRRMEVYTTPQTNSPNALYWSRNLAIHEGRHACQEQFTQEPLCKPLSFLFGESAAGFLDVFWGDVSMMEGDAVCAETGLTEAGRGRSAAFLEYYRVSFDSGEFRNYEKWRYGSLTRFTPDYYKIGYIMQAGIRTFMDSPQFMADTYRHFTNPHSKARMNNFRRTAKESTGLKFKQIYETIADTLSTIWKQDMEARAPFQPTERACAKADRFFPQYEGITMERDDIFTKKESLVKNEEIVCISPDREEKVLTSVSGYASALDHSEATARLYWSDFRPDIRYEKHSYSDIKWMDPFGKDHKVHTLVKGGHYFNPKSHSSDSLLAAVQIMEDGCGAVTILSEVDGSVQQRYLCPDGYYATEVAWFGDIPYCIAQSPEGMGIYRARDFKCILEPSPVEMKDITAHEDLLLFVADRTGESELYAIDPVSKEVLKLTNLRHGGGDFVFYGDYLYFTALKTDGRYIYRTHIDDLPVERVKDFSQRHRYAMAEALSEQETESLNERYEIPADVEPQPYRRFKSAVNLHSWMPAWVDYDEVSNLTYESIYSGIAPGVTGFFQNELGTLYGYTGVSYAPMDSLGWVPGAHLNFSYRGIFPVITASVDATQYGISGVLQTYIPLNFSSNGWSRGIVPQVSYAFGNNYQSLTAAVSAYSVLPAAQSRYYPIKGIGGTAGYVGGREYVSAYAYSPGFGRKDGFRFSALWNGYISRATAAVSYALPFADVDWGWGDFIYVRNFEFLPSYGYLHQSYGKVYNIHYLSVGADAVLGHLWVARSDIRLGCRYTYRIGHPAGAHDVSLIMSVDL